MQNPRDDLASVLERINARIDKLESRLAALEQRPATNSLPRPLPSSAVIAPSHPLALSQARAPGAVAAIGKLFLGIAGGYLLRHLAESGALPQIAMIVLAILYAAGWLVWSTRMPSEATFASAASAATAALIFFPMLSEVTARFKLLPDAVSAALLTAFALLALALAWKRNLTAVVWISTFFSAATALVLLVATGDPAPFTFALLVLALCSEYAGLHDRWRSLRPAVALFADCAIMVLTIIYSGQAQLPPEYKPINAAVLLTLTSGLFAIYGTSIAISTLLFRQTIGIFEIGQTVLAFALAIYNGLRITHDAAAPEISGLCLLLAAACYFVVLVRFVSPTQTRNYHVFATWGAALLVTGNLLLFQPATLGLCLSIVAVAATFSGIRLARWTLSFHGLVYLGLAGYFSGLWSFSAGALAGTLSAPSTLALWTTIVAAVLCCAAVWSKADSEAPQLQKTLRLLFSSSAIYVAAALTVTAIVWITSGGLASSAPKVVVIRTLVLCAVILALSFLGARRNHAELIWISYATIALCAVKLLYEDLRYGTAGSIAISLSLYGIIWLLVPRLLRSRETAKEEKVTPMQVSEMSEGKTAKVGSVRGS